MYTILKMRLQRVCSKLSKLKIIRIEKHFECILKYLIVNKRVGSIKRIIYFIYYIACTQ